MQIEKVTLNQSEVDTIFNTIIEKVNPQWAADKTTGHDFHFPLNENIEVYTTINLYVDYSDPDSNGQTYPTHVTVLTGNPYGTKVNIFSDGKEVEGIEKTNIDDLICGYNWIKYF